jgi:hypothetical protein
MGIEPTFEAWEAPVLPLNYTRMAGQSSSAEARLQLAEVGLALFHESHNRFNILR